MSGLIYLFPVALRRGHPVMQYIYKEKNIPKQRMDYWLVTCYVLKKEITANGTPCDGVSFEYNNRKAMAISRNFYTAFKREAALNEKKYKETKPETNEEIFQKWVKETSGKGEQKDE